MYWRYNGGTLRIQDAEFLGGISVPPNIREAFSISTHRIEFAFQEKDTYKVLTYDIPVEYEGLVANPSAELYWNDWDLILAHYTEASYIKKLKVAESNISSVSVTVDAPKIGAKPDYTAIFPSGAPYYSDKFNEGNYRNDIGWWDENAHNQINPDTAVFQAGSQYKVYVYLTAQDGYAFTDSTTATLNGQPAETSLEDGQLCVMYPFAAMTEQWGAPTYTWSSDYSKVTATRVSQSDSTKKETETVNTTSAVTKAATCTAKGITTYTATFKNTAFTKQTKAVENIAALGHSWDAGKVTKQPTTTEEGIKTYTCQRCGATKTETIPKLTVTVLIGDVNQDGFVDATDRMILSRYLAKWDGYAAKIKSMDAADIDRNGLVEAKDRMILARYLAKWTGYESYFK